MSDNGQGTDAEGGWRPSLGAWVEDAGVRFRVWAPERRRVEVVVEGSEASLPLGPGPGGYWEGFAPGFGSGALYRYRLDGEGPFPDPASRFQPRGVHGPSRVVDPRTFAWTDEGWSGVALEDAVV
jgi:maltooligosyltrehalose trehalohydrolase